MNTAPATPASSVPQHAERTPEDKCIRIAELSGRCTCKTYKQPRGWESAVCDRCGKNPYNAEHTIPNYLSDLNAMHTAEEARITDHNWRDYWENLEAVVSNRRMVRDIERRCIQSTAAQRAEAFLLTLDR